jgi:LuxR family maltose regulon positive regulatory protein
VESELDAKVYPRFVLARIEQACGRLDAALDLVHEIQGILQTADPPRSKASPQAYEAQLWLQRGSLAAAVACAERAAKEESHEELTLPTFSFIRFGENVLLVPIQVLIAQGKATGSPRRLHKALALLDERRQHADRVRATWVQIKTRTLQALAYHSLGDVERARGSLEQALALGEPEHHVRVFADEGAQLADLLREIPVGDAMREYVATLLSAIHPTQ